MLSTSCINSRIHWHPGISFLRPALMRRHCFGKGFCATKFLCLRWLYKIFFLLQFWNCVQRFLKLILTQVSGCSVKTMVNDKYKHIHYKPRGPLTTLTWAKALSNLSFEYPRMLRAKFGWIWPSGSGKDFQILSKYFCYFVIISPWKEGVTLHLKKTRILFTQRCFVPSLVEIGPGSDEEDFLICQCIFAIL